LDPGYLRRLMRRAGGRLRCLCSRHGRRRSEGPGASATR
jgi:hypothetical protein